MSIIIGVSSLAAVLAFAIVAFITMHKYRGKLKVLLYMKFGWHPFDRNDDTDIDGKVCGLERKSNVWYHINQHICDSNKIWISVIPKLLSTLFSIGNINTINVSEIWCFRFLPSRGQPMGATGIAASFGKWAFPISYMCAWTRFHSGRNGCGQHSFCDQCKPQNDFTFIKCLLA